MIRHRLVLSELSKAPKSHLSPMILNPYLVGFVRCTWGECGVTWLLPWKHKKRVYCIRTVAHYNKTLLGWFFNAIIKGDDVVNLKKPKMGPLIIHLIPPHQFIHSCSFWGQLVCKSREIIYLERKFSDFSIRIYFSRIY